MVKVVASAKARILIVDDSSLVRLYYRAALKKAGFEVEQAINGIEALERALSQSFDLVIDTSVPSQRFTTDCEVCCRPFEVGAECEPGEILSLDVTRS